MKIRLPQKFAIFIGGYTGPSYKLELKDGRLLYSQFEYGHQLKNTKWLTPNAKQWEAFWKSVDSIDIWNWEKEYIDSTILDGTSWSIDIKLDEKIISSKGINSYPANDVKIQSFLEAVSTLIDNEEFS